MSHLQDAAMSTRHNPFGRTGSSLVPYKNPSQDTSCTAPTGSLTSIQRWHRLRREKKTAFESKVRRGELVITSLMDPGSAGRVRTKPKKVAVRAFAKVIAPLDRDGAVPMTMPPHGMI